MTGQSAPVRRAPAGQLAGDHDPAAPEPSLAAGSALRVPLGILGILSVSAVDRWGNGLDESAFGEPASPEGERRVSTLPSLPGFVESTFSPLAFEASRRCLSAHPGDGARTAVVLASLMGDTTTADLASQRMAAGRVHNPLLFMQATANSVLGFLSREFGITGQQLSISTVDDPAAELLTMADLMLDDPELDRVLVVAVELAGGARVAAMHQELAGGTGRPAPSVTDDLAVAILLGRAEQANGAPPGVVIRSVTPGAEGSGATAEQFTDTQPDGVVRPCGSVHGLLDLATTYRQLRRDGGGRVLVTDPAARCGPAAFAVAATPPAEPAATPPAEPAATPPAATTPAQPSLAVTMTAQPQEETDAS